MAEVIAAVIDEQRKVAKLAILEESEKALRAQNE